MRRARLVFLAALGSMLVALGVPGDVDAAAGPAVDVVDSGGARVDAVINIGPALTAGSVQLQLRATGKEPVEVSALQVKLRASSVQSSAYFDTGDLIVTLAPGVPVSFTVEVTGVTTAGTIDGTLSGKVGGKGQKLADVTVTRRNDRPLTVNGKTAPDGVTIPVTSAAETTFDLTLENASGDRLTDVALTIPDFANSTGTTRTTPAPIEWPDPQAPGVLDPGATAKVRVNVALPRDGATYTSDVVPIANGLPQRSITVSVQRTSEKPIKLVGATGGSYVFEVDETSAQVAVLLQNSLTVPVEGVKVLTSSLSGPEIVPARATVGGADPSRPFTVGAGEVREILVTADLSREGTYTGSLQVIVGDVPNDLAALKVSRKITATHATVLASSSNRDVLWAMNEATTTARVVLTDDAGTTGIACVTIAAVEPKQGTEGNVSTAVLRDLTPLGEDGATQTGIDGLECEGKLVRLQPRQPTAFRAEIGGLPVPGSYEVTFSVTDGSRTAVSDSAEVTLRRSGLVAIALIMLGAGASFGLTAWGQQRTKTRQRRRIAQIRRWCEATTELLVGDVVATIRTRCDTAEIGVAKGETGVDEDIESLLRQAALLRPFAAIVKASNDAATTPSPPAIGEVRAMLVADEMDLDAQQAAIDKLEEAWRAILLARRSEQQVRDLLSLAAQASESGIDTSKVTAALTAARTSMAAGDSHAMSTAIRQAETEFRAPLAEALGRARAEALPDQTSPALRESYRAAQDQAAAAEGALRDLEQSTSATFAAYNAARRRLAVAQANAIVDVATQSEIAATQNGQADVAALYATAKDTARQAAAGHLLKVVLERVEQARREMTAARNAASNIRVEHQASTSPALAAPGASPPESGQPGSVAPDVGDLSDRLPLPVEFAIALITFLVAGLLGWQFLWAGDPTWGSWPTMVAAFLWGFGLTGATYTGIRPLMKTVTGAAA